MKGRMGKAEAGSFLMIELVFAFAIFVFIAASFHSIDSAMTKYRQKIGDQSHALSVVDNALERISAVEDPTAEMAEKIFRQEFGSSPLSGRNGVSVEFRETGGELMMRVRRSDGKVLANAGLRFKSARTGAGSKAGGGQ